MGRRLAKAALLLGALPVILLTTEQRAAGVCAVQTVMSPQGNGAGVLPSISGDGRYMAFASLASDLLPGDLNGTWDVFLYDRLVCTIERVSVSSIGGEANGSSLEPSISDDGRYVAFYSLASNLGPTADTNGAADVFVRDRLSGVTLLASPASNGGWANGLSLFPAISGDGHTVAFWSGAPDLVAGDTNGEYDVFVRDLVSNTTMRVSVATGGLESTGGDTALSAPALSNDGRYVAFESSKIALVIGDTNGVTDVFRHDRQTGSTILVSVPSGGGQTNHISEGRVAISGDGRYVAFGSGASNLVAGDTNGAYDVFVRDVTLDLTTRVSLSSHGGQGNADSLGSSISSDGRYVAFHSAADSLVVGDTNGKFDVFVHDRQKSLTRRISASAGGVQGNNDSYGPSLSDNGLFVGFTSLANTLVSGDTNNADDAFVTNWPLVSAPPNTNLLLNGDFTNGLSDWGTFALPNANDIVWDTSGGVLRFYREIGSTQAVVLQSTGAQLLADAPLTAQFDLGNSGGRKRISVLIHDGDFTDLSVCTLWLDAGAPMRTYVMRTNTTKVWSNATISFYAATADSSAWYRVDNVSLLYDPAGSDTDTHCVDPSAPAPPGGAPSANLLTNGDFSSGLTSWGTFGQIVWQIASGVFEFYRPAGAPAGVVLQASGDAMVASQILTATFDLGNSSSVRKRATMLIHEADFSDLSACTFWLTSGQPLSTYSMRMFTTKAWTNATVSIYPATVGVEPWIRLDNVSLQSTPSSAIVGTECIEPAGGSLLTGPGSSARVAAAGRRSGSRAQSESPASADLRERTPALPSDFSGRGWEVTATTAGVHSFQSDRPLDLREARRPQLMFQSWLSAHRSSAEVQVSLDGTTWRTIAAVPATDHWMPITVDLSDFAGHIVSVRFVLHANVPVDGAAADRWRLKDIRIGDKVPPL